MLLLDKIIMLVDLHNKLISAAPPDTNDPSIKSKKTSLSDCVGVCLIL